jgi:hypothetical protein
MVSNWQFDVLTLQAEVKEATRGWDWGSSFAGHGKPLLTASQLPPEFRNHPVNLPHAQEGELEKCCPTLAKFATQWLMPNVEVGGCIYVIVHTCTHQPHVTSYSTTFIGNDTNTATTTTTTTTTRFLR